MLKKNQLFMSYFTCLAEIKLLILSVFTLFLILKMAAKMATMFDDVTGLQKLHHP